MLDPTIIEMSKNKSTGSIGFLVPLVLFVIAAVAFKQASDFKKGLLIDRSNVS